LTVAPFGEGSRGGVSVHVTTRSAFLAAVVCVALSLIFFAHAAAATPRPLPFTYTYETLGEGELDVTEYVDLDPIRVPSANSSVEAPYVWALPTLFQTEFEYGITDRLELGLYVTLAPTPNDADLASQAIPTLIAGDGVKERLRYRLLDEGRLPIDAGLFGELTENEQEFGIEAKLLLQKRIRNLRIAANISGQHAWYFAQPRQDWIFNPSAGVTYQVTPVFQPGVEAWMWWDHTDPTTSTLLHDTPLNYRPNVYVGPAILFDFGKFWWSTGVYFRVTSLGYGEVKEGTIGSDAFGPLWFRTLIGIQF
jgi:hypothetical protein